AGLRHVIDLGLEEGAVIIAEAEGRGLVDAEAQAEGEADGVARLDAGGAADQRRVDVARETVEIADIGEEHGGIARIDRRQARLEIVEAGAGRVVGGKAGVGIDADLERILAGARLEAQIADEEGPAALTAVELVMPGQLDVADVVAGDG